MKKFAFVTLSGNISYIVNSNDYTDGAAWNTLTIREVSTDLSDKEFIETHYYKDGILAKRDKQPNGNYKWIGDAWVFDEETFFSNIRLQRDTKLSNSDWTVMPDSPLSAEKQAEWQTYRQALRDVPANNASITHLDQVVWPTPPA